MNIHQYYATSSVQSILSDIKEQLWMEFSQAHMGLAAQFVSSTSLQELGTFVASLQERQGEALKQKAKLYGSATVRIPAKLFKDKGLEQILRSTFVFKASKRIQKWDFQTPHGRLSIAELIQYIQSDLITAGLIQLPVIAFAPDISQSRRVELADMAKRIQGKLSHSLILGTFVDESHPNVSHILYDRNHAQEQDSSLWYRTIEKHGGFCLLHYWYIFYQPCSFCRYKPDSEDIWMKDTGEYVDPEPVQEHQPPWHISSRWLEDSLQNNEWMVMLATITKLYRMKKIMKFKILLLLPVVKVDRADKAVKPMDLDTKSKVQSPMATTQSPLTGIKNKNLTDPLTMMAKKTQLKRTMIRNSWVITLMKHR